MAAKRKEKCLTDNCDHDEDTCGLCRPCYQKARRDIRAGIVTVELLVEAKRYRLPHTKQRTKFGAQLEQILARKRKPRKWQNESQPQEQIA